MRIHHFIRSVLLVLTAVYGMSAVEAITVVESGTVGINNTNPDANYKLDIGGDAKITGGLHASGSLLATYTRLAQAASPTANGEFTYNSTTNRFEFYENGTVKTLADFETHSHAIADVNNLQTSLDAKQAADAELASLAGLTSAADKLPYFTGVETAGVTDLTAYARGLLDDADAATARTTLSAASAVHGHGFADVTNLQATLDGKQALDTELTALAGLASAADTLPYFTGEGTAGVTPMTAFIRTLLDDANAADACTTLGVSSVTHDHEIADVNNLQNALNGKQTVDADLTALAGLTSAADKLPYFTAAETAGLTTLTAFARTVLDDADAVTARATLGAAASAHTHAIANVTNLQATLDIKQAVDGELTALAGLSSAADKLPYFTGASTAGVTDLSAYARTLLDDADAAAARTTLELDWMATQSNWISGAVVTYQNDAGADATDAGGINSLQVYQGTANADALMAFHIAGQFACYFGLDGDTNDLVYGGWSLGANKYRIWTERNTPITAFAKTLLDDADAVTARATLGVGTGDVTGPGSSTDNAIARYDAGTGKILQNSGCTIDDANNLTVGGNLNVNNTGGDAGVAMKMDGSQNTLYAVAIPSANNGSAFAIQTGPAGGGAANRVVVAPGGAVTVYQTAYLNSNVDIDGSLTFDGAGQSIDAITTAVDSNSTNSQIPTAAAVNTAIQAASGGTPEYGSVYGLGNTTNQDMTTHAFVKVINFNGTGLSSGSVSVSAANSKVTINQTGIYEVTIGFSGKRTGIYDFTAIMALFFDGSAVDAVSANFEMTGNVINRSVTGIVDVTSTGKDLDLRIYNESGTTRTCLISSMSITVKRLGDT